MPSYCSNRRLSTKTTRTRGSPGRFEREEPDVHRTLEDRSHAIDKLVVGGAAAHAAYHPSHGSAAVGLGHERSGQIVDLEDPHPLARRIRPVRQRPGPGAQRCGIEATVRELVDDLERAELEARDPHGAAD